MKKPHNIGDNVVKLSIVERALEEACQALYDGIKTGEIQAFVACGMDDNGKYYVYGGGLVNDAMGIGMAHIIAADYLSDITDEE